MPSLKQLKNLDTIDSAYLDKAIVYLESEDDVQIIKERWFFDEGRYVEFKSTDDGLGGGCERVIDRVILDRSNGVKAFGIIDRDVLLRCGHWNIWWETNDSKFAAASPFEENVQVLRRWEIENYLLTPNELEIVLSDRDFRTARPTQEVINILLKQAEDLKILSAAAILCHKKSLTFPDGFGNNIHGEALSKLVTQYLTKHIDDLSSELLPEYIEKVEAFAEGISTTTYKRWDRLNRMLDGKRVLQRLGLFGSSITDRRGDLARHIRINQKIDPEFRELLKVFKEAL
ncbi:MAG: DUF4435 domain-containing protein [Desulfobacteraceae bacterium]|nr:MAG: DUF4435 domain-containing protein [Desulfobacteraceae bacterium]